MRNPSVLLVASLFLAMASAGPATAIGDPELVLDAPELAILGKVATFTGRLHDGGVGLAFQQVDLHVDGVRVMSRFTDLGGRYTFYWMPNERGVLTVHTAVLALTGYPLESDRAEVFVAAPPSPPREVVVYPGALEVDVEVSWLAPHDDGGLPVDEYHVERVDVATGTRTLVAKTGMTRVPDALGWNRSYRHEVVAVNAAGASESGRVDHTTPLPPPPLAVEDLATSGDTRHRIVTVSWSPPDMDPRVPVDRYHVHRSVEDGPFVPLGMTTSSPWLDEVEWDVDYHYHVVAENEGGMGDPTLPIGALLPLPGPPGLVENIAVSGDRVTAEVTVAWEPPLDDGGADVTGYVVERSDNGSAWSPLASVGPEAVLTDPVLYDVDYTYRIQVVTEAQVGEWNTSTNVTIPTPVPPSPPVDLHFKGRMTADTIDLVWSPPADDGGLPIEGYRVYSSPDGLDPWTFGRETTGTTEPFAGEWNSTYHYRVTAVTRDHEGAPADLSFTVPARSELVVDLLGLEADEYRVCDSTESRCSGWRPIGREASIAWDEFVVQVSHTVTFWNGTWDSGVEGGSVDDVVGEVKICEDGASSCSQVCAGCSDLPVVYDRATVGPDEVVADADGIVTRVSSFPLSWPYGVYCVTTDFYFMAGSGTDLFTQWWYAGTRLCR
ncbi:MAG: fibronectin type III domain-containing protein [Euryarchaeota archaeon]|nr:fibronectin type III domain-containing protein [Euryarchaeota archaeon]